MSFGSAEMNTALNVSAITDLLDTYATEPALFNDVIIPQDFGPFGDDGETLAKSINFYRLTEGGFSEFESYNFVINCRAGTMGKSEAIASMVKSTINRVKATDYFIRCEVGSTIPPQDDRDNYNTILDVVLKLR